MLFSSAFLAAVSLIGSASAQCSLYGSVNAAVPGAWSFPNAIAYTDNVLSFKLNYAPTGIATVNVYVNDSRVTTFPKTLTFSASNFNITQDVEVVLADAVSFTPPYPIRVTFAGSGSTYTTNGCTVPPLTSLETAIVGRRTGFSTTTPAQAASGCNAFVTIANPTTPAPVAFIQSNQTTYVDNVLYPRLFAAPAATTTISVTSSTNAIVANVSTLTFTTSNWNVPQPIALTLAPGTTVPLYTPTIQFSITTSGQSFAIPAYNYGLRFTTSRDGIGCNFPPTECFLN